MSKRVGAFWASAAGVGWVLFGYPLALLLAPSRPWRRGAALPSVSVLIPTCSEHELLAAKLHTVAELGYPPGLVQVIVVADGDAALAAIARDVLPAATVRVLDRRSGKPAALNVALGEATGELVVITDAHSHLSPGSLTDAVRHFADPDIWGVTGRWGERGSAYDAYEHWIRRLESRSGSTTGISGSFLMLRRTRIPVLPADVVNDDLWLAVQMVRGGGRVIYEPAARTVEPRLAPAAELARRSRIGAGRQSAIGRLRDVPPGFAWRLASHKLGRLALPFLLVGSLASSLALVRRSGFRAAAAVQLVGYGLGAAGATGKAPGGPVGRLARAAGQFLVGNIAVGAGVIRATRGRQSVRWEAVR